MLGRTTLDEDISMSALIIVLVWIRIPLVVFVEGPMASEQG